MRRHSCMLTCFVLVMTLAQSDARTADDHDWKAGVASVVVTPSQPMWMAGYSNDVFAYIPSARVLREGGYEGGGAMRYSALPGPFKPSVEERIMTNTRELVMRLRMEAAK